MTSTLLLKLLLTPVLIGLTTLAGRRWGGRVAGWLVGFPLTSAPVALILALEQGSGFARDAAEGTLLGTGSQALFAVAYFAAARRRAPWSVCLAGATAVFTVATLLLRLPALPVWAAALLAYVLVAAAIAAVRPQGELRPTPGSPPRFDLPARMVVATVFVVVLTGTAPLLGARLSGLISPFPLYATVLAVFAHRAQGAAGGIAVMSGLALGLVGFAAFFVVLALALQRVGIAAAFVEATVAVAVVQGCSLVLASRRRLPSAA